MAVSSSGIGTAAEADKNADRDRPSWVFDNSRPVARPASSLQENQNYRIPYPQPLEVEEDEVPFLCTRIFLVIINSVFFVIGFGMVIMAIIAAGKPSACSSCFAILRPLLVSGMIMTFVSCFGFFGAVFNSYKMLLVYVTCVTFLLLVQMIVFFWSLFGRKNFRQRIHSYLTGKMRKSPSDLVALLELVQERYDCCGVDGPMDYHKAGLQVPRSCCRPGKGADCSVDFMMTTALAIITTSAAINATEPTNATEFLNTTVPAVHATTRSQYKIQLNYGKKQRPKPGRKQQPKHTKVHGLMQGQKYVEKDRPNYHTKHEPKHIKHKAKHDNSEPKHNSSEPKHDSREPKNYSNHEFKLDHKPEPSDSNHEPIKEKLYEAYKPEPSDSKHESNHEKLYEHSKPEPSDSKHEPKQEKFYEIEPVKKHKPEQNTEREDMEEVPFRRKRAIAPRAGGGKTTKRADGTASVPLTSTASPSNSTRNVTGTVTQDLLQANSSVTGNPDHRKLLHVRMRGCYVAIWEHWSRSHVLMVAATVGVALFLMLQLTILCLSHGVARGSFIEQR